MLLRDIVIAINIEHRCTVLVQEIRDVISRLHLRGVVAAEGTTTVCSLRLPSE